MCPNPNAKAEPPFDTWVCSDSVRAVIHSVIAVALSFGVSDSTLYTKHAGICLTAATSGAELLVGLLVPSALGCVGRSEIYGWNLTVNWLRRELQT